MTNFRTASRVYFVVVTVVLVLGQKLRAPSSWVDRAVARAAPPHAMVHDPTLETAFTCA